MRSFSAAISAASYACVWYALTYPQACDAAISSRLCSATYTGTTTKMFTCCDMAIEDCSLGNTKKFTTGKATLVFPLNSTTSCITPCVNGVNPINSALPCASSAEPFAFQVIPGHKAKLSVHLKDGGVCVTASQVSACDTVPDPLLTSLSGIFDESHVDNPYRDYTSVMNLYCTGDFHIGKQGYLNQVAVNSWISAQQTQGHLRSTLSHLLISGSSAGAAGVIFWAPKLLSSFSSDSTLTGVVVDSFLSIAPSLSNGYNVQSLLYGPMLSSSSPTLNMCPISTAAVDLEREAALLPTHALLGKCFNFTLTAFDAVQHLLEKYPRTPVGYINSKLDSLQVLYWNELAVYESLSEISRWVWYEEAVQFLSKLKTYQNFVPFIIEAPISFDHVFLMARYLYNTTTASATNKHPTSEPGLVDWLRRNFPASDPCLERQYECYSPTSVGTKTQAQVLQGYTGAPVSTDGVYVTWGSTYAQAYYPYTYSGLYCPAELFSNASRSSSDEHPHPNPPRALRGLLSSQ